MARKYKITWGDGYSQDCSSKTEALKIASDLLNTYKNVAIETTFILKFIEKAKAKL